MRDIKEDTTTQAVIAAMRDCKNPRPLTDMTSLVQHLHSLRPRGHYEFVRRRSLPTRGLSGLFG